MSESSLTLKRQLVMAESVSVDVGGGRNDSIVVIVWYLDTKVKDVASVILLSR